jgi:LmbE family N-acetylglucosaminyl deacetylase
VHIFSTSENIDGNAGIEDECREALKVYGLDPAIHHYPTMHFQEHYQDIRDDIFNIKLEMSPDIIYCKSPRSLHPDHRAIGEACESIFLESTIYGIEGIRDGHNQRVNKWVTVTQDDLDAKMDALSCYKSQTRRAYSNAKTIEAWARFRGNQVGVEYAEGMEVIREVS